MEQDTSRSKMKPMVLYLGLTKEEIYSNICPIKKEPIDSFDLESETNPGSSPNLRSDSPCLYRDQQDKEESTTSIQQNNPIQDKDKNLQVVSTIKNESEETMASDDVAQDSMTDSCIYTDHQIKEELVIGPTVLQRPIIKSTDTSEKPEKETNKDIDISNKENNSLTANLKSTHIKTPLKDKNTNNTKNVKKSHISYHKSLVFETAPSHTKYICDYCQKCFKIKIALMRHIKEHMLVITSNHCNICNNHFNSTKEFRSHLSSHKIEKNSFQCKICTKTFTSIHNLRRHVKLHDETLYSCDDCHKTFKRKDYIANHIKQVHQKKSALSSSNCNTAITCDICQNSYRTLTLFKRHLNYHKRRISKEIIKGNKTKLHVCDFCNRGFVDKRRLIGHINNHMNVPLPYSCGICSNRYANSSTLSRHLICAHSGKLPFSCKTCNRYFMSKWGCAVHERKCTNYIEKTVSKPVFQRTVNDKIICKSCNREFASLFKFTIHWNKNHNI